LRIVNTARGVGLYSRKLRRHGFIYQTTAKPECESLGANYALISNPQWMAIARDSKASHLISAGVTIFDIAGNVNELVQWSTTSLYSDVLNKLWDQLYRRW
jgi:hypothetical protein